MIQDLNASEQGKLIGANVTIMSLSALFVALRFLARKMTRAGIWYDDYAIIVALLLAWMTAVINLIGRPPHSRRDSMRRADAMTGGGSALGKHVEVSRSDAIRKWSWYMYIFDSFYTPAIAAVKFSILLFYARVFPSQNKRFRWALYVIAVTVFLWWIICQFLVIFDCSPIHSFWDREPLTAHCLHLPKILVGQAVPNIVTDFVLLTLPLPLIWELQLPAVQRLALSGIFLLGSLYVSTTARVR